MQSIGLLMMEHRKIERMIRLMKKEMKLIRDSGKVNEQFINTAIDFMKTYADRCHHGKEEDILFEALKEKNLESGHHETMNELIEEHKKGRKLVRQLAVANESSLEKGSESVNDIISIMGELVEFYPKHIAKEDKHFFFPSRDYFTEEERINMLDSCNEFDRKMIHDKYEETIAYLEEKAKAAAAI